MGFLPIIYSRTLLPSLMNVDSLFINMTTRLVFKVLFEMQAISNHLRGGRNLLFTCISRTHLICDNEQNANLILLYSYTPKCQLEQDEKK